MLKLRRRDTDIPGLFPIPSSTDIPGSTF